MTGLPLQMNMDLNYRLAETRDLQNVYGLYMHPASNAFLTYDPMPVETFHAVYVSLLAEKNLFVVDLQSELIATYRLIKKTHRQSHIAYLGGFSVKDSMKGKGIGFMVLQHIKQEAQAQFCSRIELTVDTENHPAINLYRKVGFEIEGKLKNNYRLASSGKFYDEYIMALLLS
jgi:L-phenylalanine/L-methionine N-acetyltransferase